MDTVRLQGFHYRDGDYEDFPVVTVVGAGGIGARIVPTLVKMMSPVLEAQGLGHLREGGAVVPRTIYVIDPDEVVERNIYRQPFIKSDVGKPKAEVIAKRYAFYPHVKVIPVVGRVEDHKAELAQSRIVIGAVDGVSPRKAIWDAVFSSSQEYPTPRVWIDAGNDEDRGQVMLEGWAVGQMREGSPTRYLHLKGLEEFPHLVEGEDEETEGCGLRIDTQTPCTNTLAAALVLSRVHTLLQGGVLGSLGCRFSLMGGVQEVRGKATTGQYEVICFSPVGV